MLARMAFITALMVCSTACSPLPVSSPTDIEMLRGAISAPYRISESGRFILDISVDGRPAQPFAVDTGATVSAIYDEYTQTLSVEPDRKSVFVKGLIAAGRRPIIDDANFRIEGHSIQLERLAVLETPKIRDEAIGLLGADILANFTALFNKDTLTVTFVPSEYIGRNAFSGWARIPVQNGTQSNRDTGLYFTHITLGDSTVPVLIDTGSKLNLINWRLATLDEDIRQLERKLREEGMLQGALETTKLTTRTAFKELLIGNHYWPSVDVFIMELDALSDVAPVDDPMMIAGAGMFSPHTLAIIWRVDFKFGAQAGLMSTV